jgi:type IV secretion system protein VirD4
MRFFVPFLTTVFLTATSLYVPDCLAYGGYDYNSYGGYAPPSMMDGLMTLSAAQVASCIVAALIGAALGAFFSDKFKKFRRVLFLIMLGLSGLAALMTPAVGQLVAFVVGFIAAYLLLSDKQKSALRSMLQRFRRFTQTTFGSSTWATLEHLQEHNLTGEKGLFLGTYRLRHDNDSVEDVPLHYAGDRHLMTVAAARGGKGVSSVIPNLLTHEGSLLAIDVKGELSMITAARRGHGDAELGIEGMGQDMHVCDPWGITGLQSACFNPMDWLDVNDPDMAENAMILWDSIIISTNSKETFWDDEAKSVGVGITLHVATAASEAGNRTLGRVRDIIVSGATQFDEVLNSMLASTHPIVRSTALRTASKDMKLLSNVMATLQSHTHFLDSTRLRENMSRSDFKFEDLKTTKMSVYLVLPADRLDTFNRWLRMMIQQAITVNARNIEQKPEKPILFMLDEVAALGKMPVIPRAYGLMAGYGMMLWSIVQNLSQLEEIYGQGWETFIGNSGVLQYYGSRDCKSAEYFSKLAGVTTAEKFSWSQSISKTLGFSSTRGSSTSSSSTMSAQGGSSSSTYGTSNSVSDSVSDSESDSETRDVVQRPLILPDELMIMRRGEALVLVENLNPIKAYKVKWYEHPLFRSYGVNLEKPKDCS